MTLSDLPALRDVIATHDLAAKKSLGQNFLLDLNLTSKIRFKIPFYYGRSWICYLNPIKTGGVTLAFIRGNELSNSHGILESKNRKQVMSIDFDGVEDIPSESIMEIIHEAILLDETIPYASKNKKK